jgi:hypothetical protein
MEIKLITMQEKFSPEFQELLYGKMKVREFKSMLV